MFGSLAFKILGGGAAAILLVGGIFYLGNSYGAGQKQQEWDKNTITELNNDLAEQKLINSKLLNFTEETNKVVSDVDSKVQENTRVIRETQYVNRDVVREVFRDSPFLSEGIIYTHNQLALGAPIDPAKASDQTVSAYGPSDLLSVVGENYANHRIAIEKNEGWNSFYDGIRAASVRAGEEGTSTSGSTPAGSTGSSETENP